MLDLAIAIEITTKKGTEPKSKNRRDKRNSTNPINKNTQSPISEQKKVSHNLHRKRLRDAAK